MNYRIALVLPKWVALVLVTVFFIRTESKAQIIINEIVASNSQGISDEDGDYPDWIEFYNPTEAIINLSGYGISDDPQDPFKFVFSDIEISSNDYYLVFASDKNRGNSSGIIRRFWETIVMEGDNTKYIIPNSAISNLWIQTNFDDSSWENGTFGIGYGDDDDATVVPNGTTSIFTRTTFTIDDLSVVDSLLFHISFDDGYVAYINGVEISRFNMSGAAPIPYNEFASTFIDDPALIKGEELPALSISNYKDILVEGENILAIQIHNSSSTSSDLSLIPFLSVSRSKEPETSRGIASQIKIESNGITTAHLNFKLSSAGETIWLTNPDSVTVDEFTYPELLADESFGRGLEDSLYIFNEPTPLAANTTQGFTSRSTDPEVVQQGGVYASAIQLELVNPSIGDNVYFTTDGSNPTQDSEVFGTSSRTVTETTVFKFIKNEEGKLPSKIVTQTYLIATDQTMPIFSISTDPDNLWSDENGIYVIGTNGIQGNGYFEEGGANWNQDWEIPVFIEYYEVENTFGFSTNAGAKIFGGWSRSLNPQKSLAIYFRGDYGNPELEYKLFDSKEIDRFQAFVLRNSGNDFNITHLRDGLMTTLVEDTEIDFQAYEPAVVYLNGEYWGIHNLREKINEHFIESNNPQVDSDNIDMLESNLGVVHGSTDNYLSFLSELENSNMNDLEDYQKIEELIDIENYIDYMVSQIYFSNTDWPGNNIKYWRDKNAGGKWRWILYDTDFGFGFQFAYGQGVWYNTLDFALEASGPGWPNPPWSTYVFRKMTESDVFVTNFVNRMADLMNTSFEKDRVNEVIDSLSSKISPEMPKHFERWGGSVQEWGGQIDVLKSFANNRRTYMENYLISRFNLSIPGNITANTSNAEYGSVRINRVKPKSYPWVGRYFGGVTIPLTAIPKRGYRFAGWSGASNSTNQSIEGVAGSSYTANFEPVEGSISDVVINEIMYNSSEEKETGDWIELYNYSDSEVDLSGWQLKDNDDSHTFAFPNGTEMPSGSYLIIASDLVSFNAEYENVSPLMGELGFNLSGNTDQVRLFDSNGALVDSLQYSDETPWDSTADGNGFTLELIDPNSDNSLPQSWKSANVIGGTPGAPNSVLVANEEQETIPSKITLNQNYPNPFNPSTNISFELPKQVRIKLSVFDMLGRRVSVLADEIRSAGTHSFTWDALEHSSGVYFYRLEVGKKVFTQKMLLIK